MCLSSLRSPRDAYEKLVEGIQPQRKPEASTRLPGVFALQNMPTTRSKLGGLSWASNPLYRHGKGRSHRVGPEETRTVRLRSPPSYAARPFGGRPCAASSAFRSVSEGHRANSARHIANAVLSPARGRERSSTDANKADYRPNTRAASTKLFEAAAAKIPDAIRAGVRDTEVSYAGELNRARPARAAVARKRHAGPTA